MAEVTPLKSATAESLEAVMFSDAEPTGPDSPLPPPTGGCSAAWPPGNHHCIDPREQSQLTGSEFIALLHVSTHSYTETRVVSTPTRFLYR